MQRQPPDDSQETARLDEDSERSSVVDYRISPTLASRVLALTWSNLVKLHVLLCLAYTLYLLM